MDIQSNTTMGGDRTANTNYSYRSRSERLYVNVKTTIKKAVEAVRNTLRHYELIARPEVRIQRNLPALPAAINR